MFEWIQTIANTGSTGIIVSLVLALEAYLRDRRSSRQEATIQDYCEWVRRKEHADLRRSQQTLLDRLDQSGEDKEVLVSHLEGVLETVQRYRDDFSQLREQIERLPEMNQKLDLILEHLNGPVRNRLMIDSRVLDVLTGGLQGSGVRIFLKGPLCHHQGTLMVVWRLGSLSPHLMLADLVGGIDENRLSLILNSDSSITLRVYDGCGAKKEINSPSHVSCEYIVAFAVWRDTEFSLWTNNERVAMARMNCCFTCLGPTLLFGIDVEGSLSADAIRWSSSGLKQGMQSVIERGALDLQKEGIWHGSRHDCQLLYARQLSESEIHWLTCYYWNLWIGDSKKRDSSDPGVSVIGNDPRNPAARILTGFELAWQDDFRNAISEFGEAIRINPSFIEGHFFRGLANNLIGEVKEAVADYRRALALDPRSTEVHARLAWVFATASEASIRSADAALEHAHAAFALGYWRPDVLDVLAAAYAEAGDFTAAVKHQELAFRNCSDTFKQMFEQRLNCYIQSMPFRDTAWASLREMWRANVV